ncbi:hypothetical protein CsSME_00033069 [Camellia sinensis var. sinensis]
MLSKAPPVPQPNPTQASEEHPANEEDESNQSPLEAGAVAAGEELTNPVVGDRIIEEQRGAPLNANPGSAELGVPRQVPAGPSREQLLQRSVPRRVQKPADDRLFTWAAVGLTIAIVVLLLKKFLKASGHGAVFMDGS